MVWVLSGVVGGGWFWGAEGLGLVFCNGLGFVGCGGGWVVLGGWGWGSVIEGLFEGLGLLRV